MDSFSKQATLTRAFGASLRGGGTRSISILLLACLALAAASCGGSSSNAAQTNSGLGGNWQFSLAVPADNSFEGSPYGGTQFSVLQGGFLVQQGGSLSGQALFSIWLPPTNGGNPIECNSGAATITGTLSGQTVNLTATLGTLSADGTTPTTQTFTLTNGQLSSGGSAIQGGTYSSTAGYYIPQGSTSAAACGTAETGINWSATEVPALGGAFQGFFHSLSQSNSILNGQVFPVTGSLIQGPNIGASSATVTGSLTFTGYPCISTAAVNGVISGNSVVLQLFNAATGAQVGQIGNLGNGNGATYPVTYDNTLNGYALQNLKGSTVAYAVNTSNCPGSGLSISSSGDAGNVCLGFGVDTNGNLGPACNEPITLSPASLTFPAQALLSGARTREVVTLNNIQASGSQPLGVNIQLVEDDSDEIYPSGGDFNGFPNFTETNTCAGSVNPQQYCTISITFTPQQSCPWIPGGSNPLGLAPAKCPGLFNPLAPPKSLLNAVLQVTISGATTPDSDPTFTIPLKGTGLSSLVPSTPELDFGAVNQGEVSLSQQLSQSLTFTNQSTTNPVQILSAIPTFGQTCNSDMALPYVRPRPPAGGTAPVPGLLMVATNGNTTSGSYVTPDPSNTPPTVEYYCDYDTATSLSTFQISSDTCSGQTIQPNGTCGLTITFAPQPDSYKIFPDSNTNGGLDYFLELNTLQCDLNDNPPNPPPSSSNPCEIDSGRFPVEITANPPSPLRMAPAAGLDFGTWLRGTTSTPVTLTLTNDQANNVTVTLTANALSNTDYVETNLCPLTLSPGATCQLSFTLAPTVSGFDSGNVVLEYNYTNSSGVTTYDQFQYIYLRGFGQ